MAIYCINGVPYDSESLEHSDRTFYLGNVSFNGDEAISHGRTKGSRNGISTTPGYKAKGKLAGYSKQSANGEKKVYYAPNTGLLGNPNPGKSGLSKKWNSGNSSPMPNDNDGRLKNPNKVKKQVSAKQKKKNFEKGKKAVDKFLNKNRNRP